MTDADIPQFTLRLMQLARAYPGKWFFDEATTGAYAPSLMRFEADVVFEALAKCTARFDDPPTAKQVVEVAQYVADERARAAQRRVPPSHRLAGRQEDPAQPRTELGARIEAEVLALQKKFPSGGEQCVKEIFAAIARGVDSAEVKTAEKYRPKGRTR